MIHAEDLIMLEVSPGQVMPETQKMVKAKCTTIMRPKYTIHIHRLMNNIVSELVSGDEDESIGA